MLHEKLVNKKLEPNIALLQIMRNKLGVSYAEIGRQLNASRSAVSKWFAGLNKMKKEDALRLCTIYPELNPTLVFMENIDFPLLETDSMKYHALSEVKKSILINYWDLIIEISHKWSSVLYNFSQVSNDVRFMYLEGIKNSGPVMGEVDTISVFTEALIDVGSIAVFRKDAILSFDFDNQMHDNESNVLIERYNLNAEVEKLYDDYLVQYKSFEAKAKEEEDVSGPLELMRTLDDLSLDLIYYLALSQFQPCLHDAIIETWLNIEFEEENNI
jgi:transcriptional regulator with XRE-family HTH domain